MIHTVRVLGIGLMAIGAILLLTWFVEPLRFLWPWFRGLPKPIQFGLGASAFGLLLVIASRVAERVEEREYDRSLLDEP